MTKRKGFALINLTGLTLGLASVMTLGLLLYKYYTTDDIQTNKSRMYYLKSFGADDKNGSAMTTFPLLDEIKKTCPEIEAGTHLQWGDVPWLKYGSKEVQEDTRYVEEDFFKVFSFPLAEGNPATAFKDKFSIVISQNVKQQLFGNKPALGKTILADDSIPVTVGGVLAAIPSNSSVKVEVLFLTDYLRAKDKASFEGMYNWYNVLAEGYLVLKKGANVQNLNKKINEIAQKFYVSDRKGLRVSATPFGELKKEGNTNVKAIVAGSIAASVFILLIITFNLLNLNAASMLSRTKEVAVRQIIGSEKRHIIFQFCVENGMIIFGSLITAFLLFIYFLLPQVNSLLGENLGMMVLSLKSDYVIVASFIFIALIIIAIGVYPVLHIVTAKTTDAIKGNIGKTGDRGAVRKLLLTAQFTLAIILICSAIILNKQIGYMKVMPLGFEKDNVTIVNLDLAFKDIKSATAKFEVILNSLKNNPYVEAVSAEHNIPTAYDQNYNEFGDVFSGKKIGMRQTSAGKGYVEVFKIPIVGGRNFDDQLEKTEGSKVILNETAVQAYGWKNAVGKQIKSSGGNQIYTVIGVMKDFHYDDMQTPIGPLIHFYNRPDNLESFNSLAIRINKKHIQEVISQLKNEFKNIPARRDFSYKFMDDMVDKQYIFIAGILKITNYVALLTIAIACMGMLGLITLSAKRRVKEIGVRKVLGASVANITALISKDFIKIILAAILIASPIAWYIMKKWLQDFAYQVEIKWWMFALAGIVTLVIALLTVSFQAVKAALANPVKSLRSE
ncbi:ABC transporter permease [Rubrolithibacter danxiaensis]|uniref:ABC transporter permease n=1 Tax=Rubrolithibacter danxiaensis TaxID=3390805 RepID=UPI003BF84310